MRGRGLHALPSRPLPARCEAPLSMLAATRKRRRVQLPLHACRVMCVARGVRSGVGTPPGAGSRMSVDRRAGMPLATCSAWGVRTGAVRASGRRPCMSGGESVVSGVAIHAGRRRGRRRYKSMYMRVTMRFGGGVARHCARTDRMSQQRPSSMRLGSRVGTFVRTAACMCVSRNGSMSTCDGHPMGPTGREHGLVSSSYAKTVSKAFSRPVAAHTSQGLSEPVKTCR